MADSWRQKVQTSTSDALQNPTWACRHGAKKYSTTQQSQNQRWSLFVPTSSPSECLQVLLLPSHHQRGERLANQNHWCRQPQSIQGRSEWHHCSPLYPTVNHQTLYIVLVVNTGILNFGRWWLSHPPPKDQFYGLRTLLTFKFHVHLIDVWSLTMPIYMYIVQ